MASFDDFVLQSRLSSRRRPPSRPDGPTSRRQPRAAQRLGFPNRRSSACAGRRHRLLVTGAAGAVSTLPHAPGLRLAVTGRPEPKTSSCTSVPLRDTPGTGLDGRAMSCREKPSPWSRGGAFVGVSPTQSQLRARGHRRHQRIPTALACPACSPAPRPAATAYAAAVPRPGRRRSSRRRGRRARPTCSSLTPEGFSKRGRWRRDLAPRLTLNYPRCRWPISKPSSQTVREWTDGSHRALLSHPPRQLYKDPTSSPATSS